jgi:hypothetical protein
MKRNAIPQAVRDERSDRQTAEQCRLDYRGNCCVHPKGHYGPHHAVGTKGALSWNDEETKPE